MVSRMQVPPGPGKSTFTERRSQLGGYRKKRAHDILLAESLPGKQRPLLPVGLCDGSRA